MAIVNLVSRLKVPITIVYSGKQLIVPPQGRAEGLEDAKLGVVPSGVTIIKVSESKPEPEIPVVSKKKSEEVK